MLSELRRSRADHPYADTPLTPGREGHLRHRAGDHTPAAREGACILAVGVRLDVTIEADWEAAMARVLESRARLDVLVVSAGISLARPVDRSRDGVYEPVYAYWLPGLEAAGFGYRCTIFRRYHAGRA